MEAARACIGYQSGIGRTGKGCTYTPEPWPALARGHLILSSGDVSPARITSVVRIHAVDGAGHRRQGPLYLLLSPARPGAPWLHRADPLVPRRYHRELIAAASRLARPVAASLVRGLENIPGKALRGSLKHQALGKPFFSPTPGTQPGTQARGTALRYTGFFIGALASQTQHRHRPQPAKAVPSTKQLTVKTGATVLRRRRLGAPIHRSTYSG